jgi:hypothetical protein
MAHLPPNQCKNYLFNLLIEVKCVFCQINFAKKKTWNLSTKHFDPYIANRYGTKGLTANCSVCQSMDFKF